MQNLGIGVRYEPVGEVLTACSDSEETNLLALNVAVDLMERRRSVAEAKDFYHKTLALLAAGKSSAYTQRLLFTPSNRRPPRQPGQIWPLP